MASKDKYIIKNCPCCFWHPEMYWKCEEQPESQCQDCTDCVLKLIYKSCKAASEFCKECSKEAIYQVDCIECTKGGKAELGTEILELLDIEEVE